MLFVASTSRALRGTAPALHRHCNGTAPSLHWHAALAAQGVPPGAETERRVQLWRAEQVGRAAQQVYEGQDKVLQVYSPQRPSQGNV